MDAVKGLFHKIKNSPPIRQIWSEFVPYEEWKSLYMDNELSNMASSEGGDSRDSTVIFDYEFVGIRRNKQHANLLQTDAHVESIDTVISVHGDLRNENVLDVTHADCGAPKVRSPGSTIETKSKSISDECRDRSGGSEPTVDPQVEAIVTFLVEEPKHGSMESNCFASTTEQPKHNSIDSNYFSENGKAGRGSSVLDQIPQEPRPSKRRIREVFRKLYQRMKRLVTRKHS